MSSYRRNPVLQEQRVIVSSMDDGTVTPLPAPYCDIWDIDSDPTLGLTLVYQFPDVPSYMIGRVLYINKSQDTTGASVHLSLPVGYTFSQNGAQVFPFPDEPTSLLLCFSESSVVMSIVGGAGAGPLPPIGSASSFRANVDNTGSIDPITGGLLIPAGSTEFSMPFTTAPMGLNIADAYIDDPNGDFTINPTSILINNEGHYCASAEIYVIGSVAKLAPPIGQILLNGETIFTAPPLLSTLSTRGGEPFGPAGPYSLAWFMSASANAFLLAGEELIFSLVLNNPTDDNVIELTSNVCLHRIDDSLYTAQGPPGIIQSVLNTGFGLGLVKNPGANATINIKGIEAGANVNLTNNSDSITIAATGIVESVNNAGTGIGLVQNPGTNTNINMKDLTQGANIVLTDNGTSIDIAATVMNNVIINWQSADPDIGNNTITRIDSADDAGGATALMACGAGVAQIACPTGQIVIDSPDLEFISIPNNITADVLYYDTVTKEVSYGTIAANPNSTLINFQTTDAAIGNKTITEINAADAGVTSSVICTAANLALASTGPIVLTSNDIEFPSLPSATKSNLFYYDTVTKKASYGVQSFSPYKAFDGTVHTVGPSVALTTFQTTTLPANTFAAAGDTVNWKVMGVVGNGTVGAISPTIAVYLGATAVQTNAPALTALGNTVFVMEGSIAVTSLAGFPNCSLSGIGSVSNVITAGSSYLISGATLTADITTALALNFRASAAANVTVSSLWIDVWKQ